MPDIQLTSIPDLSAIYYALLQNGYEFCYIQRDAATIQKLHEFASIREAFPYFSHTKQSSCEVYPYWPRAALLETASFFADPCGEFQNLSALHQTIHSMKNINDSDRDDAFLTWLSEFPAALREVQRSKHFHDYFQWESNWLEGQKQLHADKLSTLYKALSKSHELLNTSPVKQIEIVISPIKCVYSADYHLFKGRFIFSSGRFDASSVIHESLHPAVHALILPYKNDILSRTRRYDGLDSSYYLGNSEEGALNAFEEALVRSLTAAFMSEITPDLDEHIAQLLL